jgi:hypothetical protein
MVVALLNSETQSPRLLKIESAKLKRFSCPSGFLGRIVVYFLKLRGGVQESYDLFGSVDLHFPFEDRAPEVEAYLSFKLMETIISPLRLAYTLYIYKKFQII